MAIDLDHFLANPVYDPSRCSIGFHPLHQEYLIVVYLSIIFIPNKWVRLVGIGLSLHIATDFIDCVLMDAFS